MTAKSPPQQRSTGVSKASAAAQTHSDERAGSAQTGSRARKLYPTTSNQARTFFLCWSKKRTLGLRSLAAAGHTKRRTCEQERSRLPGAPCPDYRSARAVRARTNTRPSRERVGTPDTPPIPVLLFITARDKLRALAAASHLARL